MIYNLTSVKRVIAKVFTDLNLQEGDHRITDMIEWAGEALEKIGGFPTLINKVSGKDGLPLLEISNYQTKLPCDFHNLIQIGYAQSAYGPFYPMRYATGSFDSGSQMTTPASDTISVDAHLYEVTHTADEITISVGDSIPGFVDPILIPTGIARATDIGTTDITYMITGGFIKTNVASGYLMVAYQAIPTDNEGYPMIPDHQSFMEAIYWYITMKLLYPEWAGGRVRDAVYADAKRSWNFYCKQAYGVAMTPNGADQLETIKNTWHRLVEEFNEHDTFFSTMGQEQVIYNNNGQV